MKGGAGRSTLSTNLAGELSKVGKTVLIDGDMPQGTSASWFTVRQEATATNDLVSKLKTDTATTHKELLSKVEQHQDADFIILDCPPRIAEMTRAALVLSDLCLVPVGASALRYGPHRMCWSWSSKPRRCGLLTFAWSGRGTGHTRSWRRS